MRTGITAQRVGAAGRALGASLAVGLALLALPARPVAAQGCAGDCDGNGTVAINDVITLVDIALGTAPLASCASADTNNDGYITVSEIVSAVNTLLAPPTVSITAACFLPPDENTSGEPKPCPTTSPYDTDLYLYRCTDLAHCATDPNSRVLVASAPPDANGEVKFTDPAGCNPNTTRLVQAVFGDGSSMEVPLFVSLGSPGTSGQAADAADASVVTVNPLTEAAVRLADHDGLQNFGAVTFATLLSNIQNAVPLGTLAGKSVADASTTATNTAQNDADVQAALGLVLKHHVPMSQSIDPEGDVDHYQFELHDFTTVILQMTRSTGSLNPCLEVQYYGTGQIVPGGHACGDQTVRLDLSALPAGTYDVFASDRSNTQKGSYDLTYLRLRPEDETALVVEQTQAGALVPVGQVDPYVFTVTQPVQAVLHATQVSSMISPCIELWQFASQGSTLVTSACDSTSAQLSQTLSPGTYFVVIYDQGNDDEGSYALKLLESAAGAPTPTPITTWDAGADYSVGSNPNGPWSYGRKFNVEGGSFDLMTVRWGDSGWYLGNVGNGGPSIQGGPELWAKNNGNGLPVVRWTAPETGLYRITGKFIGADSRGVDSQVYAVVSESSQFAARVTGYQTEKQFDLGAQPLAAGDPVDFIVQWAGGVDSEYSWTQLDAVITLVALENAPTPTPVPTEPPPTPTQSLTPTSMPSPTSSATSTAMSAPPTPTTGPAGILWSEDFDDGNASDRWSADNGVWQIGSPAIGPQASSIGYRTHSGPYCATTGLTTNYPELANSRLYRIESFTVPPADQSPRLTFWQWFNFASPTGGGADYGVVEVKVGTDAWQEVSPRYYYNGGDWTYASVDLSDFAGQTVRVAFHLVGQSFNSAQGWYVDDIAVVTGTPVFNNPEGWENGIGDWYADRGIWQVGTPSKSNGAPKDDLGYACHGGINCAATLLDANYPAYPSSNSRLVSPPFVVPPASSNPSLRFWHWYSLGGPTGGGADSAIVEIKAGTGQWQPLITCAGSTATYTLNSGGWSEPCYDLTVYGGQTVQIAFHIIAESFSSGVGWYVDDILITGIGSTGSPTASLTQTLTTTATPSPTLSATPSPTNSPVPSNTSTVTAARTATAGIPSSTSTPIPTATRTAAASPTSTLTPTATQTSTPPPTLTATATASATSTATPTATATGGSTPQVVFQADFEAGWGDWYADNGIWQVGLPTSGPGGCFDGSTQCAATNLTGSYPDNSSSRLISPNIQLPDVAADQEIRLRFEQWVAMGSWDSAVVEIADETSPGVWSAWQTLASYTSSSGAWAFPLLDISSHAGNTVRIGFLLSQGNSGFPNYSTAVGPGWYVDSVEVSLNAAAPFQVNSGTAFVDGYEGGWGDWYADNGIWQIGLPASGPAGCFNGSALCAATNLTATYPDDNASTLISPKIQLPAVATDQAIRLAFEQWLGIGSWDVATVEISDETTPGVWSAWQSLASSTTSDSGAGWGVGTLLDISSHAGKTVRIGFLLSQGNSGFPNYSTAVGSGWYIDDVQIRVDSPTAFQVSSSTPFSDDYETGAGDWYADNGIWQVGLPSSGPAGCFNGSGLCAATNLAGTYPDNSSSTLISPTLQLPTIAGGQQIRLRFEQWVAMGNWDTAVVEIADQTAPGVWTAWAALASYTTSSGAWAYPLLDISSHAGKTVRIGFLLSQGNSGFPNYSTGVGPGWYIDNVTVSIN